MKNKGFTLIELLGSIVILAIIATVAFPAILNFLSSSQNDIDSAKISVITRAAKDYVTDNPNEFKRDSLNTEVRTDYLINNGYITNKEIIQNEKLKNSCVKVSTNIETKKYQFEYTETCS